MNFKNDVHKHVSKDTLNLALVSRCAIPWTCIPYKNMLVFVSFCFAAFLSFDSFDAPWSERSCIDLFILKETQNVVSCRILLDLRIQFLVFLQEPHANFLNKVLQFAAKGVAIFSVVFQDYDYNAFDFNATLVWLNYNWSFSFKRLQRETTSHIF